ncbi:RDD family protein [Streptomyces sp. F63]|uniref:RDD family protein n=1 Tax=Streptomyces sp. F63 TaxID=2824887 RepID=UPI001B392F1D|nr:RDD family protein [Streptomyces sp. F63]MBQ0988344.1 RDD family protein [Streptomyces sp. F63]
MSAPTPGSADGGPAPGYYPDPSIPGYIRYWNGASWVPGTSRPAPGAGDPMPPAPPTGAGASGPPPAASPAPAASSPSAPSASPSSSSSPPVSPDPSVPAQDRTGPMYFDEIAGAAAAQSGGEDGPAAGPRGDSAPAAAAEPGPGDGTGPAGPRRPGGPVNADDPRTAEPSPAGPADPASAGPEGSGGPTLGLGSGRPAAARRPAAGGPTLGLGHGSSGPGGTPAGDDEESGATPSATAAREGTMTLRASGTAGRSRTPGAADPRAAHGTPAAAPGDRADRPAPGRVPDQGGAPAPDAPAAGTGPRAGSVPRPAGENDPRTPGTGATTAQPPADGGGPARTPGGPLPGPDPQGPQRQTARQPAPGQRPPQWQSPRQEGPVQPAASPAAGPREPSPAAAPGPAPAAGLPGTAGGAGVAASWPRQVERPAQPGAPAGGAGDGAVAPWRPPVDDPFLAAVRAQAEARPAGLGRRLLARLLDTAVFGVLLSAAAVPLGVRTADHLDAKIENAELTGETVTVWLLDGTTAGYLGMFLAALLLLGVVYEVLPTARWGRTLGKRLCGVRVTGIESHENPSFAESLRRWLVYSLLGLLVVGVVNVLWCFVDRPWRQCWHDKAARTFVASGG